MVKALCDDSHVARYCSPVRHQDERPLPAAFELRDNDDFLSSNWIEYFGMPDLKSGMTKVREEFGKHYDVRKNGRFAVLNVGAAKKIIKFEHDVKLLIEDLEDEDYPSHASITFPPEDSLLIAITLSEMIKPHDMHSGIN